MTLFQFLLKILSKPLTLLEFLLFFGKELVIANVRLAHDILTPRLHTTPGIVRVPLDMRRDIDIALLANLLTLTPGTLTLDISPVNDCLYVHVMYLQDVEVFRTHVKQDYERRVMELLR